jgi:hypothetical protein
VPGRPAPVSGVMSGPMGGTLRTAGGALEVADLWPQTGERFTLAHPSSAEDTIRGLIRRSLAAWWQAYASVPDPTLRHPTLMA